MSASPHIHAFSSTRIMMWTVIACLAPAGAWGVFVYGIDALLVIAASVASAVACEAIVSGVRGKVTVGDGSAVLTGLLVAYNMPPAVPGFIPVAASAFAILVVKQTFGGLGRNWMNPALAGRVFAMFCWTPEMTGFSAPVRFGADAVSAATPLHEKAAAFLSHGSYLDLFIGNVPGCIGEVSKLLLVAGAIVLFATRIVGWVIPVSYLASFCCLVWIFGDARNGNMFGGDVLFQVLTGGLVLGALYMATDPVTTPLYPGGMFIFGIGCGFLTFFIRTFGSFPEGVSLAIILMNMTVPLVNRITKPKKFGYAVKAGADGSR